MITEIPLLTSLEKTGVERLEAYKLMFPKEKLYNLKDMDITTMSLGQIKRACENLGCEIRDLIEYIDEDGNVPEFAGYALCEEDRYDLPHIWTPLIKMNLNLTVYERDDYMKFFGYHRSKWYYVVAAMKRGEWVALSKESVKCLLEFTGCELWELCEDVKPRKKRVPLEQILMEYKEKKYGEKNAKEYEKSVRRQRAYLQKRNKLRDNEKTVRDNEGADA